MLTVNQILIHTHNFNVEIIITSDPD